MRDVMENMNLYYAENNLRATKALLAAKIWYGPGAPVWPVLEEKVVCKQSVKYAEPVRLVRTNRNYVLNPENITPMAYISAAAELGGVTVASLMVKDRRPTTVFYRRAAIICIWDNFPAYGVSRIGRIFDCDHSTISHALTGKTRPPTLDQLVKDINNLIAERLNHV